MSIYNNEKPNWIPIESIQVTDKPFEVSESHWQTVWTSEILKNIRASRGLKAICEIQNVTFEIRVTNNHCNHKQGCLLATIIIKSYGISDFKKKFYLQSKGFKSGAKELLDIWQKQLNEWQSIFNPNQL